MDCARNIITANFSGGGTSATTAPLWQWDYGQVLCITGIDLPAAFEVHFSTNRAGGVSTTAVGADGQVTIPNVLLTIGKNLNAWIYLSDSEGEGETEYSILIPVKARPMPETYDAEVTGEFDDVVRQVSEYAETAQTAADNAGASASAAAASASEAAASTSAADAAKTASETAQGEAEDAQAAAETAAQTATQEAQQTAQDAAQAASDAGRAESAAQRAEAAETGAESAKTDAETAAQGAAASASAASASATSAGQSATAAAGSATAAAGSATTAQGAAQTATTKAGEASASATAAAASETAAQTAQTAAEAAKDTAVANATTATTKAAEAAQSASNAAQSKTDAEAAATRAEQAAATLTVDTALSDTSTNPVQNKVITGELTDVKSAIDALKITNTASGAIASFPDGAAMPMESLTVEMSPIQDLHGYDSPWPGGGGKNLLDINNIVVGNTTNWSVDVNGDTLTVTHKTAYVTGTPAFAFNQPSGTYVVSIGSINITGQVSLYINGAWTKTLNNGDTFTIDAANTNEIRFSAQESRSTIITKIQIESGSTATSYAPYSNICPITGRDSVTVTRTGKNLLDIKAVLDYWGAPYTDNGDGSYTVTDIRRGYTDPYQFYVDDVAVSMSAEAITDAISGSNWRIELVTETGTTSAGSVAEGSLTSTNKVGCRIRLNYSTKGNGFTVKNPQIEFGNTITPYAPATVDSVTIQLGQTVYGGTLDVVNGKLTVDFAIKVFNGTEKYSGTYFPTIVCTGDGGGLSPIGDYNRRFELVCSHASDVSFASASAQIIQWRYVDTIFGVSNADEFKAYVAQQYTNGTPVTVAYPIATPLEITLDPTTLSTLRGDNTVWSDGDSVEVTYVADPKLYISRLTEPDADMIADANITSGSYFMVGNTLYLATANIASGAAITPGVNCNQTNLAAALNAINA